MASQIILIADGQVLRDDGDVIRHMLERIAVSGDHLDRLDTQVASRRQVEDTELAALRADIDRLKTDLADMLLMRDVTVVDPTQLTALAGQIRDNTARIRGIIPDPPQGA